MIFAETDRLYLRALDKNELPRLVKMLDVWDVVRWLEVKPFPCTMRDAEEFYADLQPLYEAGQPEFFTLALKSDNLLIGGIGLHAPRGSNHEKGEIEIGYWLARDFWNQGLITEAANAALAIGFSRHATRSIGASTSLTNHASQNVLRKIGLREKGIVPRDYNALRGENEIMKWLLTREEYLAQNAPKERKQS